MWLGFIVFIAIAFFLFLPGIVKAWNLGPFINGVANLFRFLLDRLGALIG